MRNGYPDWKTYQALYARYYGSRGVAELLHLLEPLYETRVLDLCCGDGQMMLKALDAGASMGVVVDTEPDMVPSSFRHHARVRVLNEDVLSALFLLHKLNKRFDRVVCRQAVNYWLQRSILTGEKAPELVAQVLAPGGVFVFNTFNQKPPEKSCVLQYELGGRAFVEVSWLVGDIVHHVQIRDGMSPHHTAFAWLAREQFLSLLEPCFAVTEERREKTSLYRCVRK